MYVFIINFVHKNKLKIKFNDNFRKLAIMKKSSFILVALMLIMTVTLEAQKEQAVPKATILKEVHDFGKVAESSESISYDFVIRNVGNAPLLIQSVQTTCGCTTPNYTKNPILPGKDGIITITYSTIGRPGAFIKKITVFTNVPDQVYTLTIKGEVLKKK